MTTTLPAICPCCGQAVAGPGRTNVGLRVRIAREAKGWSQTRLGQTLSRPRTHAAVSELETGKTRVHVEDIEDIAWLLGVDAEWLLTGKARHEPSARGTRQEERMTPGLRVGSRSTDGSVIEWFRWHDELDTEGGEKHMTGAWLITDGERHFATLRELTCMEWVDDRD